MKCKVCGAYNEDYLEYCENCAAPLTPDEPEPIPAEDSYVASTGETPPAWGFVRAPQWPKPEFDANTVSEEDIPANYSSRFNPRPAQQQAQAQQPSAPAPTDAGYRSNVRVHMPAQEPVAPAAEPPRARVHTAEEAPVRPIRLRAAHPQALRVLQSPCLLQSQQHPGMFQKSRQPAAMMITMILSMTQSPSAVKSIAA